MAEGRKTILVAGPPFRGYSGMIVDAFAKCGLNTAVLEWQYKKRNLGEEIMYYSSKGYRTRLGNARDKANALVLEKAVLERSPDYVLVLKAVDLTEMTVAHCANSGTKTVLWAYDSAAEYPIIGSAAPKYDLVYTYEPADIEALSRTCSPKLLPMAFDPRFYFRKTGRGSKSLDICFVGAVDMYPQRRRLLKHISDRFREKTIGVWTDSAHWYSHKRVRDVLGFGSKRNVELHRQTLDHASVNDIYNRSRICVNVHHRQSVRAVNPRTFEILGSGGLLITDRRLDEIEGFEGGEGYVHYSDESELMDRLGMLLEDEQKAQRIADAGYLAARTHTYEQRARTILDALR